jgi:hypothetical protein
MGERGADGGARLLRFAPGTRAATGGGEALRSGNGAGEVRELRTEIAAHETASAVFPWFQPGDSSPGDSPPGSCRVESTKPRAGHPGAGLRSSSSRSRQGVPIGWPGSDWGSCGLGVRRRGVWPKV